MLPFILHFRVSKQRRIIAISFALCLMAVIQLSFSGSLNIIFSIATILATYWAWQEPMPIKSLAINTKAQAFLTFSHATYEAHLLSGSVITPYVCWLKWQLPEKILWQCVWQDSLTANDFRRLRVWASFGKHQVRNLCKTRHSVFSQKNEES